MSEDQENARIVKSIREHAELNKKIAVLLEELRENAESLAAFSRELLIGNFLRASVPAVDMGKLGELLNDYREAYARRAQLRVSLEQMGVPIDGGTDVI